MPLWLQYLIAFAVLIVLAPIVAWSARRYGGRVKGGMALASFLLGFGFVMDPPSKHIIEASEGEQKGGPAADDPPSTD